MLNMKRGVQTSLFDVWLGEKRRKDTGRNSRNDDSDGQPTTAASDDEQLVQSDSEDDELDPAEPITYSDAISVERIAVIAQLYAVVKSSKPISQTKRSFSLIKKGHTSPSSMVQEVSMDYVK